MKIKKLPYPLLINAMLYVAGGWVYLRLKHASRDPKKSSERTLRDILTISRDTVYGKEHHFAEILAATNADDLFKLYERFVPANDFEALRPYVEHHKNGEENWLFPGKPAMYATTSGTTSQPKWVPMTRKYLHDVYGKMSHLWIWNFVRHRPRTFGGKVFAIVGKELEGYAPDGTVYGSVSGVLVRDIPPIIKAHYTAPASVMSIPDYAARNYTLMRLAIQHWDVTIWSTANPSTILELLKTVDEYLPEMIEDIEKGTLSEKFEIPAEIREELKAYYHPNPHRARELRKLAARHNGHIEPKQYWPLLQIFSTWKCGNTKIYMDRYENAFNFKKTAYFELGYIATECRFGFALDFTNESVLFPHLHYYEFVEESELDKPNKHYLRLHELEKGKRYCAYVTTYSGMFRYNMNDLIEVGGSFLGTPTIHMIGKVNGIVSLTGEKLYEAQYIDAVRKAEEEMQLKTKFFVGFADLDESRYHFYFEFENQQETQEVADKFAACVDKYLQEINLEYESKRQSFRLGEPVAHRLISNAYSRFKTACLEDGFRDGQFKFNLLMQDRFRQSKFSKLVLTNNERHESIVEHRKEREERFQKRLERSTIRRDKRSESRHKDED